MKERYHWIDNIRGGAILSMILYHGVWDLVYLYGMDWKWYRGTGAFLWQQSICWTFILISGFCWSFSKKPLKHGLLVGGAGLLVQLVTGFLPSNSQIMFGVLTLLGSASLLLFLLKHIFEKVSAKKGLLLMSLMFVVTYGVNEGYLGVFNYNLIFLPKGLYKGLFATYLGFTERGFYSADYFSLLPWVFLYFAGYFLYCLWQEGKIQVPERLNVKIPGVSLLSKRSLIVYLLHQPLLYATFELIF